MLEKAVETKRRGKSTSVQYARFADDLVILIDAERRSDWLVKAVNRRLREELAQLRVVVNEDKSRMVDLKQGDSYVPGIRVSARTEPQAKVATVLCAKAEEANGAVREAQGSLPAACQLARQEGD
jgi:hypothetical protein